MCYLFNYYNIVFNTSVNNTTKNINIVKCMDDLFGYLYFLYILKNISYYFEYNIFRESCKYQGKLNYIFVILVLFSSNVNTYINLTI